MKLKKKDRKILKKIMDVRENMKVTKKAKKKNKQFMKGLVDVAFNTYEKPLDSLTVEDIDELTSKLNGDSSKMVSTPKNISIDELAAALEDLSACSARFGLPKLDKKVNRIDISTVTVYFKDAMSPFKFCIGPVKSKYIKDIYKTNFTIETEPEDNISDSKEDDEVLDADTESKAEDIKVEVEI